MKRLSLDFAPAVIASMGLVAFAALFLREMSSFRNAVVGWAERDLMTRTELAAETLEEPLHTGDFKRIHAFGDACASDGVRLTVLVGRKGVFFDTARKGQEIPESIYATCQCGEYTIRLGLPLERVLAPFNRARFSFVLAALIGGAGVLLVFFVTYRQRVRIRELRKLERFRRDFIADVSHEIKTPLTGIIGAVDLLDGAENLPPENMRTLLGLVKKESVRLNSLAQNILSLARLEREGEEGLLNKAETDIASLVKETLSLLAAKAGSSGVELKPEVPDGDCFIQCDPQLVQQALMNLIENAIRHSGSKDVVVSLSARPGEVRVAVEDHGVGIPGEERARVFERFHRVDASRAADTGGAGLGLAIVRGIARLHGGDVALEPADPSGCRFTLSLPRQKGDNKWHKMKRTL